MLDNLFNSVKDQVVSGLMEKTGLNASQAEEAVPMAKDSITDGLMGAVSGGNVSGIMDMFSGGGNFVQNAIYQNIAGSFISKMTSKLGIPESMAGTVSSFALPMIMKKIQGEASDGGDGVDRNGLRFYRR